MTRYLCLFLWSSALFAQTASWPDHAATAREMLVAADHSASTLVSGISSSATTLPLAGASTFVTNQVVRTDNEQIQICSGGASPTVCASGRGFAGTTAVSHLSGAEVHGRILAIYFNRLSVELIAMETDLFGKTSGTGNGAAPGAPGASWPNHIVTTSELLRASDDATGTLTGAIGISDTAITLAASGNFVPYEVVEVDGELMKLCAVSGTSLTICSGGRGFGGSIAATHLSGASVGGPGINAHVAAVYHNRIALEIIALETDLFPSFGGGTAGAGASWPNHVATTAELLVASHGTSITANFHNRIAAEIIALATSLFGAAPTVHSVDLAWTASTSANITGYRIYRSTASGGPYTLLNTSSLITGTAYTDPTVTSGTYYYVATALNSSGSESVNSSQVTAVVP